MHAMGGSMYPKKVRSNAMQAMLSQAYCDSEKCYSSCKALENFLNNVHLNQLEEQLKGGYEAMGIINLTIAEADLAHDVSLLDRYEFHLNTEE